MLVPTKFCHIPVSQVLNQQMQPEPVIPVYQPDEREDFLSMVHVALKLRSDILERPTHQGLNDCKEDAIACVPESLYMFIRLMLGGQLLLENGLSGCDDDEKERESNITDDDDDDNDEEVEDEEEKQLNPRQNSRVRNQEHLVKTRVLSIAQDLVYSVSGGRRWTPKHVGLGSSLHQATRLKHLVEMFHSTGHTISYRDVRQVDTALTKHTLSTMNTSNGTVIPVNLVEGRFIHFTADNTNINEGTLDGQNTFHATQNAAWQRGPESVDLLGNISSTKSAILEVPKEMNAILPAYIREGTAEPQFREDVKEEWFKQPIEDCPSARQRPQIWHFLIKGKRRIQSLVGKVSTKNILTQTLKLVALGTCQSFWPQRMKLTLHTRSYKKS